MLNNAKTVKGYKLESLDGEIGKVREFYFDDQHWVIRYLVVDTGDWPTGRQVLISPYASTAVINKEQCIKINLTKKQIKESPSLDSDKPVSRQFEDAHYGFYGWPRYWGRGAKHDIIRDHAQWRESTKDDKTGDPFLRSTQDVTGHHIQAADGEIGHVEDFIIDSETWTIPYLLIYTRNWWHGKKILVSKQWIERISWLESKVFINLPLDTIRLTPEFTEQSLLTRDYETRLNQHYNRQIYWIMRATNMNHPR